VTAAGQVTITGSGLVCDDQGVRHGIVEGEPGIFPAPIARLFQAIGRLFGRRSGDSRSAGSPPPPADADPGAGTSTDVSDLDPKPPDDTTKSP
jgi:hypothetical protein